jgi:hypothetical protein
VKRWVVGWILTPMHRFLQLEPSWFRSGQTTSLFESVIEKEEVREDRGGILTPPCAVVRAVSVSIQKERGECR